MYPRIVLFVDGPCHGEMRMVDGPSYRVPLFSQKTKAGKMTDGYVSLDDLRVESYEYRMMPFGVLNRVVWMMVPTRTPEPSPDRICDVLLSGRALDCSDRDGR